MNVYVFPGQGSQHRGMGEQLFDEFSELTKVADNILGYSIKELCLEDPRRELNKTQFTQPALFVVNALSYYKKLQDGPVPDYVAGHSLGEFNALLAAECIDFPTGLKLVKKRGELMAQAPEGAMAAILNASKEEIEKILKESQLNNIDLANFNTFSQIVISGPKDEIAAAETKFQSDIMLYYPLNTSGAFHSRLMRPITEKFQRYLKKFIFSEPKIPVISNVVGKPYAISELTSILSRQISSCVLWAESMEYLISLAHKSGESIRIEEVGPGGVLTKLITKIQSEVASKYPAQNANDNLAENISRENKLQDNKLLDSQTNTEQNPIAFVASWNARYPIGSRVTSKLLNNSKVETRSEAVVLFGHRAAIYIKGFNGYFDLREITPETV